MGKQGHEEENIKTKTNLPLQHLSGSFQGVKGGIGYAFPLGRQKKRVAQWTGLKFYRIRCGEKTIECSGKIRSKGGNDGLGFSFPFRSENGRSV